MRPFILTFTLLFTSFSVDATASEVQPPTAGERAIEDHLSPLRASCEKGEREPCARLAYRLNSATNDREIHLLVATLTKACSLKVPVACAGRGFGLVRGAEGQPDEKAALELIESACHDRDAYACGQLAELMMRDEAGLSGKAEAGIRLAESTCKELGGWACLTVASTSSQDVARTLKLVERACAGGDPYGCYQAGMVYADGDNGVTADAAKATALYEKGCDRELGQACFNLAWQYLRGTGAPRDEKRGRDLLQRACILGDASGCDELARRDGKAREYCDLWGAEACFTVAAEITKKYGEVADAAPDIVAAGTRGCRRHHIGSCNVMGHVARDYISQCDAGQNVANACMFAGLVHRNGLELPRVSGASFPVDRVRAREAFARACKAGTAVACREH